MPIVVLLHLRSGELGSVVGLKYDPRQQGIAKSHRHLQPTGDQVGAHWISDGTSNDATRATIMDGAQINSALPPLADRNILICIPDRVGLGPRRHPCRRYRQREVSCSRSEGTPGVYQLPAAADYRGGHPPASRDHRAGHRQFEERNVGSFTHLPSRKLMTNSAWLILAAMAFNMTRAVGGAVGSPHHTWVAATIRDRLMNVRGWIPAHLAAAFGDLLQAACAFAMTPRAASVVANLRRAISGSRAGPVISA